MKKFIPLLMCLALLASCGEGPTTSQQPTQPTEQPTQTTAPTSTVDPTSEEPTLPVCTEDNDVHVIILAGQSGARGKALVGELTDEQKELNYDVDIIADGLMMAGLSNIPDGLSQKCELVECGPGFGDVASEFGPEIGMAQTMATLYPKNGSAMRSIIVKYTACGSTFIADWYSKSAVEDPEVGEKLNLDQCRESLGFENGPLTQNLYYAIDKARDEAAAAGLNIKFDGCVWSHGEQDTKFDANMEIYEKCLNYFIDDLRDYVETPEMPFVITEALSNSGSYCSQLKDIQRKTALNGINVKLVENTGLYTNTFEPWHLDAQSNIRLGNMAVAEIAAMNDTRKVKNNVAFPETETLVFPKGYHNSELPKYMEFEYEDNADYTGYSKVEYLDEIDNSKTDVQEIRYKTVQNCGTPYQGTLKVRLEDTRIADGITDDWADHFKSIELLGNDGQYTFDAGYVSVLKDIDGISIFAHIADREVWTDGEDWRNGDMGQVGRNDDLRVYVVDGEDGVEGRSLFALSAANLLRVYRDGTDVTDTLTGLPAKNDWYKRKTANTQYRAEVYNRTNVVGGTDDTFSDYELFISYEDLFTDFESADSLKFFFAYDNISNPNNVAGNRPSILYVPEGLKAEDKNDTSKYIALPELVA